jgi:tRNA(Arg) A34 adenosine deaminase TadA
LPARAPAPAPCTAHASVPALSPSLRSSPAPAVVSQSSHSPVSVSAYAPAVPQHPDKVFETLFEKNVFPHFCRVFEQFDLDHDDVDATISSGITDDGFKKMVECFKVKQSRASCSRTAAQHTAEGSNREGQKKKDKKEKKKEAEVPYKCRQEFSKLSKEDATNFADMFWKSTLGELCQQPISLPPDYPLLDVALHSIAHPMLNPDPFFSFCLWLSNHCSIPHVRGCRGEVIVSSFAQDPENCENFWNMVSLIRFCHLLRFWHRDSFLSKAQCIFELCYCNASTSMFDLCADKEAARALRECMRLIDLDYVQFEARLSSTLTSRWILLSAGRCVKQWGHRSSYDFEQCEVEKETNYGEKWRHLIFSYAVMALLYSEFNGNKHGPLGHYDFRDLCKLGRVGDAAPAKFVYTSKIVQGGQGECSDYLGHNIVALAVCKRGSILRVSYNHNVLFSSTVDHAEERLIDGLFKDPSAFIPKSHAKIFRDGQRVNIEEHMKHISVYTSLEPCQQCSGKLHIAEVPELVFCQRDWVSDFFCKEYICC